MLRLVEHALTGETYALLVEPDWRTESGEGVSSAWPVPRTVVLCADGSLWPHWDQVVWERLPSGVAPDGRPIEYHIGAWAEGEPWKTLAEV